MAKIPYIQIIVKLTLILLCKAPLSPLTAMPALWEPPPMAMRDSRLCLERSLIGTHPHTHLLQQPLAYTVPPHIVEAAPFLVEFNVLKPGESKEPVVAGITVFAMLTIVSGNLPL